MRKVVLASCEPLPPFDPELQPIVDALKKRGVDAEAVPWDRSGYDWGKVAMVVLRATWDYHLRRMEFLGWIDRVASVTKLWNPAPLVRWNSHKKYLKELEARGVPIVPTMWINQGSTFPSGKFWSPDDFLVAKPAVSAGGYETFRFTQGDAKEAERRINELAQKTDVMIQPYLSAVESHGERSLIFIDGKFSHSTRRVPLLSPASANQRLDAGTAVTPSEAERALADKVLKAIDAETLYARVDMVPYEGKPVLMELEVIEPSLFLRLSPEATEKLADAIVRRL